MVGGWGHVVVEMTRAARRVIYGPRARFDARRQALKSGYFSALDG